jgi:hypothetical protein
LTCERVGTLSLSGLISWSANAGISQRGFRAMPKPRCEPSSILSRALKPRLIRAACFLGRNTVNP